MKFIIDKDYPPKHQLTSEEKFFLQKLAGCKLMLDKSLCFQINDLERYTMLILSGNISPRKKFPDRADKEREIAELEAIITEHSGKLERGEIPKEILSEEKLLHSLWEKQLAELKKALDNPAGHRRAARTSSGTRSAQRWTARASSSRRLWLQLRRLTTRKCFPT